MLYALTANISLKLNSKDDNEDPEDDDDIWYLESGEKTTADVDTTRSLAIPLTTQELDYLVNCTRCYSFGGKNFKFRVEKYIKDGTTVIGVKCKKCGRVKTLEKKGTSIL
jgi:hypothetical protein